MPRIFEAQFWKKLRILSLKKNSPFLQKKRVSPKFFNGKFQGRNGTNDITRVYKGVSQIK